jgi:hypothetical protein
MSLTGNLSMLGGLPDRPLYDNEIDALIDSDALRLAFPAMPQSLRYDETDTRRIYDLFLFLDDRVVAVAYVENEGGWVVVANQQGDRPYDAAFDALVNYRGYEDPDGDKVRDVVKAFYDVEYDMLDDVTSE